MNIQIKILIVFSIFAVVQHKASLNMHPIDAKIKEIKDEFFSSFVAKWCTHEHKNAINKEPCNKILVLDGNWKCNRLKCAYDNAWKKSPEFGDYRIGCPNTPERQSYFCTDHKGFKLEFQIAGAPFQVKPSDIRISRLSKYLY